jgi:chromosome partitioning protein
MTAPIQTADPHVAGPHIVVLGNGLPAGDRPAGKTMAAAQLAVALLRDGHSVGTLDLDTKNQALSRFWARRAEKHPAAPRPRHEQPAAADNQQAAQVALVLALTDLGTSCDFIIIDTGPADHPATGFAHGFADTVITPTPEDTSHLATLKNKTGRIDKPSPYSEMVEEQSLRRVDRGLPPTHWIALRSRAPLAGAKKKRQAPDPLDKLSAQLGFQPVAGLLERPLYNDLFSQGLTVTDGEGGFDLARVAARQEVRTLVHALVPAAAAHAAAS